MKPLGEYGIKTCTTINMLLLLVSILFVWYFFTANATGRKRVSMIVSSLFIVTNTFIMACVSCIATNQAMKSFMVMVPLWWYILYIVFDYIYIIIGIVRINILKKSEITELSIRESVDKIPIGICLAIDGRVKHINRCMSGIVYAMTGKPVVNIDTFWNKIIDSKMARKNGVFCLPDSRVFILERKDYFRKNRRYTQIMAYNVSELYRVIEETRKKNARLQNVNERLKKYSENVMEVTKNRELLERKMNIHDSLGHLLLVSKRVIEDDNCNLTE